MNNRRSIIVLLAVTACGCEPLHRFNTDDNTRFIPAEAFSKSIRKKPLSEFSVFNDPLKTNKGAEMAGTSDLAAEAAAVPASYTPITYGDQPAAPEGPTLRPISDQHSYEGDDKYIEQGLTLRRSIAAPGTPLPNGEQRAALAVPTGAPIIAGSPSAPVMPPPGSASPYYKGQMTANPSLWPDESDGSFLFRDFRAYQPMDVISILVDDDTKGKKKADTKAEGKFDLLAGITNLFGIETKSWASNNAGLDPAALVNASTSSKFEGKGETKREGSLQSQLSGVVLEVLPNGVLRLEGSKIVAINDEEEVMVVSGLVRARDINASNQVESSRIANMRIDFYGRGVLADQNAPGWGSRLFEYIWPF